MLHAYVQIFDVSGNLENFWKLNVASMSASEAAVLGVIWLQVVYVLYLYLSRKSNRWWKFMHCCRGLGMEIYALLSGWVILTGSSSLCVINILVSKLACIFIARYM
jgi:hypothetical protein